jgi:hypothetical protein
MLCPSAFVAQSRMAVNVALVIYSRIQSLKLQCNTEKVSNSGNLRISGSLFLERWHISKLFIDGKQYRFTRDYIYHDYAWRTGIRISLGKHSKTRLNVLEARM